MSRIIRIINHIWAECLNYFFVATIIAVYYLLSAKQWPPIWKLVLFAPFPIWLYFLRGKCRWAVPFFAGHILPIPIMIGFYNGDFMQNFFVTVLLCIFAGISIKKRFTGHKMGMAAAYLPAVVGTFFTLYMLDVIVGEGKSFAYLINATFLYCAGYFVYTYFAGYEKYVDINNRTAENIPEGRAFRVSFSMAGTFTGIILLFVYLLTDRETIDALVVAVQDFLLNLIRSLVSLIKPIPPTSEPMPVQAEEMLPMMEEMPKDSLLGKILLAIISAVIAVIISVVVIMAIIGLVKAIREAFSLRKGKGGKRFLQEQESDKVEFLFKRSERKFSKRRGGESDSDTTYSRQIRKIYEKTLWQKYKILKEEKTGKLLKEATARECCLQMFKDREEAALRFAQLYEKARYAKGQCERAHVKEMKKCADILVGKGYEKSKNII